MCSGCGWEGDRGLGGWGQGGGWWGVGWGWGSDADARLPKSPPHGTHVSSRKKTTVSVCRASEESGPMVPARSDRATDRQNKNRRSFRKCVEHLTANRLPKR